jgi:enamine deaminase RidA (YjgF/YER057c/UK114 family)
MNRSLLSRVALAVVLLAAVIQLYRPERSNPPVDPALALEAGGRAPADVTALLERSCYDCHSSRTRWPWYSNVAPVSWMVADDVSQARKKLDFSRWTAYPPKQMSRKLETMNDEVMKGDMPLKQYLLLHRDARLSDSDKSVIGDWATAEAERVLKPRGVAMPEVPLSAVQGPLVCVSTILPGKATATGANDVAAQTTRALTALDGILKTSGSSLARVATVNVVLRRAEDFKAMNGAYEKFWPEGPPSRTTIVADLAEADALVGISAVAVRDGTLREVVNPPGWKLPASPYNYAIRAGDTLFLSGLVSRRGKDYSVVTGDMAAQMKVIAESASGILAAAGMSLRDVVSARVFITDVAQADAMNTAYRTWFPRDPPARATVRAALTSPDYLVEVTLVAVKAADRQVVTTPNADGSAGTANPNLSSAVRVGGRLFVSGMLGITPANKGDPVAETEEMLSRIRRTLEAAGYNWSHVTDSVVYVTDMTIAGQVLEQLKVARSGRLPTVTLSGVGLVRPDARVEIMVSAAK